MRFSNRKLSSVRCRWCRCRKFFTSNLAQSILRRWRFKFVQMKVHATCRKGGNDIFTITYICLSIYLQYIYSFAELEFNARKCFSGEQFGPWAKSRLRFSAKSFVRYLCDTQPTLSTFISRAMQKRKRKNHLKMPLTDLKTYVRLDRAFNKICMQCFHCDMSACDRILFSGKRNRKSEKEKKESLLR